MKSIRTAAILVCILGAAYCRTASGEPAAKAVTENLERPATADSTSLVTARQYTEAEPVLRVVARERPRPAQNLYAPQREMRFLVNALLVMVAAFTVFSFWGMRKSAVDTDNEDSPGIRRGRPVNRTPAESSPAVPEPRPARFRPPQSPRERAEWLKARRSQIAMEIDRLMKRV